MQTIPQPSFIKISLCKVSFKSHRGKESINNLSCRAGASSTWVLVLPKTINMNILKTLYLSTTRVLIFQYSYSYVQYSPQACCLVNWNHVCPYNSVHISLLLFCPRLRLWPWGYGYLGHISLARINTDLNWTPLNWIELKHLTSSSFSLNMSADHSLMFWPIWCWTRIIFQDN